MASPPAAFKAQPATPADAVDPKSIRFLRLPAVCDRTGLSRTQVYRLEAAGKFCRRVKISELCSAWIESEVDSWAAQRVAASRSTTA